MKPFYIVFALTWIAAQAQNLTVQVDGKPVGSKSTLNLIPGNGVMEVCTDNHNERRIDCTPSMNTAYVATPCRNDHSAATARRACHNGRAYALRL